MTSPNYAPNIEATTIGADGRQLHPRNDVEARAAGYQRIVRISNGEVLYRRAPDARELAASGEYRWERWE